VKYLKKSTFSIHTATIAIALAGLTAPNAVLAQETPADSTAECADDNANGVCDSEEGKQIVVTGSRIARPTLESPVPLTSVNPEELVSQGDLSLGDALNDLPSLRSTFSQGNSTRFIGTAGLSLLDLRGLGISRTLVLVNGRRHITALPGDYIVDVNTIPVDLLDRIDVVTGGNSAVYGSDAVAGVVNFVLKRNFDGFTVRGQGGISSRGDRGNYFVSGVYGKNFADGRGNIAIAAEFANAEPLFFRDRDDLTGAFSGRCQYNLDEPTAGEPAAGDGIPDQVFYCGVNNAAISDGGTVGALDAATNPTRRYLRFNDLGDAFIDTPTRSFAPVGSGNQIGGRGSTLRNTGMMAAGLQRYTFNLLAHYDVSDAFRPYIEAKYVHIDATQEGQPSFLNAGPQSVGGPALRCNNGFLKASALATLQSFNLCTNVAVGTFNLARFNIDFGGRGEVHDRTTYRIVAGVEGTFNEDWNYDISFNYGKLETSVDSINNLKLFDINGNPDGFNLASDAILAPVGFTGTNFAVNSAGQRVICRVNGVTNTRPDCVPINLFGFNAPSREALAFVNTTGHRNERAQEIDITASITGDLSQLFELPGGPIGFALGGEYREETASSEWDALTASGGTFLNALQPFTPPKFTVKEAFGEINIPLLKDMPLAHELTLTGAGRVSDYNSNTGTVWAWNANGIYAPIPDLRFRVAFATSVRAPTQSDLYATPSQNFAFIADPCDQANIGLGPNRVANCAAAGIPTTYNAATVAACSSTAFTGVAGVTPWVNCTARTSSTSFTSGGNPTLIEEKGKSLTVGMVFEPSFIPGLNLTVDWYRINVKDRISVLGGQQIINLCYDSPAGIANQYCAIVFRDAASGLFASRATISGGINFAAFKTEGVDFDLQYRRTFDNGHKLNIRGIATWVRRLDQFIDPTLPTNPDRLKGELGDPVWGANLFANYDFGKVDVTYNMRYIGKQSVFTWETQHPYTGICPVSAVTPNTGGINGAAVPCTAGSLVTIAPNNADAIADPYYPAAFYHNIRINFELADKKYNFYMGIDNFTDKQPPLGLLGTAGGDPYDTIGRFFYAGFKANF
jgi:outer membrane receptor protein involved in Fe transport